MSKILIGASEEQQHLNLKFANRHGLIAGATGTGKTVTLQILAEGFSRAGVPVFMADVKGDLSGIAAEGKPHPKIDERIEKIGIDDYELEGSPTVFWDLYGKQGHPIRTTISEMGPLLLARLMQLNETQEGVLHIAFAVADAENMLLLDLKDLRAMLTYLTENASEIAAEYGTVSTRSVGAIQRRLLVLKQEGAENFFGEPALDIKDFMKKDKNGRGMVNILAADKLMQSPRLYSTFLLWMLSELFEELPEAGDLDQPKMVFFFDEAHLLFSDAPKPLLEKVEQVVRLIRSKAIGVYFISQNPLDIPNNVLGQLGNRVQHALRAFTPRDQKAVKAAADTFRPNPDFKASKVVTELGVGEALVSTLEKKGEPSIVERTLVCPPRSRMGPLTKMERAAIMDDSPVLGLYDEEVDRESAYEKLQKRAEKVAKEAPKKEKKVTKRRSTRQGYTETALKSVIRTMSTKIGRELVRGLLGTFMKR